MAQTRQLARDAAELIELDVDELPAVTKLDEAAGPDAPALHSNCPDNMAIHYENGDSESFSAACDKAAHIVQVEVVNNRVAPSPLEPRSCVAVFDDTGFTLYNPSQGVFAQQGVLVKGADMAAQLLQSDRDAIEYDAGLYRAPDSAGVVTLAQVSRACRELSGTLLADTHRSKRWPTMSTVNC